jgi:hypothetical protein
MGAALYVERETYPSVIPGDEVMVMTREKGSEFALARFFVVALAPNTTYEVRSGQGMDVGSFDVTSTIGPLERGERSRGDLPVTAAADHNIYVLRCLTGRLATTIVSPHRAQMQFRSRAA